MILSQTLLAAAALSVGLISFCSGAALAVWGSSGNIGNASGAKLAGHFVALLSVTVLVFASYSITIGMLGHESMIYRMEPMSKNMKHHSKKMHKVENNVENVENTDQDN